MPNENKISDGYRERAPNRAGSGLVTGNVIAQRVAVRCIGLVRCSCHRNRREILFLRMAWSFQIAEGREFPTSVAITEAFLLTATPHDASIRQFADERTAESLFPPIG
jgi:hypothetical protein